MAQGAGQGVNEGQAEFEYGLVRLLEDGRFVVILVELLGQVVGVIGDDGSAQRRPRPPCRDTAPAA